MKFIRAATVLTLALFAFAACDESSTGLEIADLAGFWNATEFSYNDETGDHQGYGIDAIGDAGGTVTLDVDQNGSFTGTLAVPGLTTHPQTGETLTLTIGGTLSLVDQETLRVDFDQATENLPGAPLSDFQADFTLTDDVLTFEYDTTFDFPDQFEEPVIGVTRGEVPVSLFARFER